MTSRPRVHVIAPPPEDEKLAKKLAEERARIQKEREHLTRGLSLEQLQGEIAKARETLKQLEDMIQRTQAKASGIIGQATEYAAELVRSGEAEKTREIVEGKAERKRLLEQADSILAGVKLKERDIAADWSKLEAAQKEHQNYEKHLEERGARLDAKQAELARKEEKLELSRQEVLRDIDGLKADGNELRRNEASLDAILTGIKKREADIAAKETEAARVTQQAQQELRSSNQAFHDLQTRKAVLDAKELELNNREIRFRSEEQSLEPKRLELAEAERRLREREKNCDIREAQLRARI